MAAMATNAMTTRRIFRSRMPALLLPSQCAKQLRPRRGELVVRLHRLRGSLRQRYLRIAQLDGAAHPNRVPLFGKSEAFARVGQRFLRGAERFLGGAHRQPRAVDVGTDLLALQVELRHRRDHVCLRLADLRPRQAAFEDVPRQGDAGAEPPAELIERLPRLDESRVDADRGQVLTVEGAHRELICADLGLQRLHLRPRSIRLFEQRIERAVLAKDRRRLRVGLRLRRPEPIELRSEIEDQNLGGDAVGERVLRRGDDAGVGAGGDGTAAARDPAVVTGSCTELRKQRSQRLAGAGAGRRGVGAGLAQLGLMLTGGLDGVVERDDAASGKEREDDADHAAPPPCTSRSPPALVANISRLAITLRKYVFRACCSRREMPCTTALRTDAARGAIFSANLPPARVSRTRSARRSRSSCAVRSSPRRARLSARREAVGASIRCRRAISPSDAPESSRAALRNQNCRAVSPSVRAWRWAATLTVRCATAMRRPT